MKNWNDFKHELDVQCEIGVMQKLSGVEIKQAKVVFGASLLTEHNKSICLVHYFQPVNSTQRVRTSFDHD